MDNHEVSWNEFKENFRKAHIPASLMKMKQREFLALTQGGMNLNEYLNKFNQLSRYARDDTNTEEKKKGRFLEGMHQVLKTQLSVLTFPDFETLVNTARIAEGEHRRVYDTHKRKFEPRKAQHEAATSRPRTWQPAPRPPMHTPTWTAPKREDVNREPMYHKRPSVDDCKAKGTCFKCGKIGHFIADCPAWNGNNPQTAKPTLPGRVHHISAEEAREDSDVVLGTCTINTHPALILFDSGASHSFISKSFAAKHCLSVSPLDHLLVIQTPATEMRTTTVCRGLEININHVQFLAQLNTLSIPGLDAILGMDWMTTYKGVIDCAERSVTLTTPEMK